MPTCISILSIKKNCLKSVNWNIHVLSENLTKLGKERILALEEPGFKINIIEVKNDEYRFLAAKCLNKGIHVTQAALYKFDIPNLFRNIDKALYLDGDILVNRDITNIFDIDISNSYLAAVDDMGNEYEENRNFLLATRIGLNSSNYFNSGVMLLNLKKMRNDDIYQKLMKFRIEKKNYFMDQDAFNYILHESRVKIPYNYNFLTSVFEEFEITEINNKFFKDAYEDCELCLKDQFVIHMTGRFKPWKYNIPWVTELFLKYYNQSFYKDDKIYFLSPLKAINDERKEIFKEYNKIYRYWKNDTRKVWKFPFNKIKKGSYIVLYGAGEVGRDLYMQIVESEFCHLNLWVDKDFQNKSEMVSNPEEIKSTEFDYIIIGILRKNIVQNVKNYLKKMEIDESQIVTL